MQALRAANPHDPLLPYACPIVTTPTNYGCVRSLGLGGVALGPGVVPEGTTGRRIGDILIDEVDDCSNTMLLG
jgi:hypothetical protein